MKIDAKLPDFDTLSRLYREDPEAFESFRRHLLQQAVEEAPQRHRPALEELLICLDAAWQQGLKGIAQLQADTLMAKMRTGQAGVGAPGA